MLKVFAVVFIVFFVSIPCKAEVYQKMLSVETHEKIPSQASSSSGEIVIRQRVSAGGRIPLVHDRSLVSLQGKSARAVLASWMFPAGRATDPMTITPLRFDQQYGGEGVGGVGGVGSGDTTFGVFGLQVIPAVSISGRYDSNVFFQPAIAGVRRDDYATAVSPQVLVRDNGRYVSTLMSLGATAEQFVVNPELSYIGFNGALNLSFDNIVRRWNEGASLYVRNFSNYSPTPPAFLGGGSSASSPITTQEETSQLTANDTFARGIQLQRVNTFSNQSTIGGLYPVSNTTSLISSYTYAFINFGRQFQSTPSPGLFDSVQHTARFGTSHRLTGQDTVLVQYTYNRGTFSGSSVGDFDAHGGAVDWIRRYSPSLRSTLSGGASRITQDFSGGAQSEWVYTALAALSWNNGPDALTLSYSGGVFPSFVSSAGPIFSHLVTAVGTHRFEENVLGGVRINYSNNMSIQSVDGQPSLSLESKSANVFMNYRVTQSMVLGLAYNWGLFSGNFTDPNQPQIFARNEVILSLSQYWR